METETREKADYAGLQERVLKYGKALWELKRKKDPNEAQK